MPKTLAEEFPDPLEIGNTAENEYNENAVVKENTTTLFLGFNFVFYNICYE